MATVKIPTSRDIYLEVDGKKIAVVQSISVRTERETKTIEAFGSEYPVASVGGKINHSLELKKVVPIQDDHLSSVDFYSLSNFTVMIVKPDCRIVYSGCEWSSIGEKIDLNSPCIETISAVSTKRMVL
jgi:hypothetical protein